MERSLYLPNIKSNSQSSLNSHSVTKRRHNPMNSLIFQSKNQIKNCLNLSSQQQGLLQNQFQTPVLTCNKQRIKQVYRFNLYHNLPSVFKTNKLEQMSISRTTRINNLKQLIPQQVSHIIKGDKKQIQKCITETKEMQLSLCNKINEQKLKYDELNKSKQKVLLNGTYLEQTTETLKQYQSMLKQIGQSFIENESYTTSFKCKAIGSKLQRMQDCLVHDINQLYNIASINARQQVENRQKNKRLEEKRNYLERTRNYLLKELNKIENDIAFFNSQKSQNSIYQYITILAKSVQMFSEINGKKDMEGVMKKVIEIEEKVEETVNEFEQLNGNNIKTFDRLYLQLVRRREKLKYQTYSYQNSKKLKIKNTKKQYFINKQKN